MYIYTDDDLTRINRDYLGPKGKRLPWVATYRVYGVILAVLVAMFGLFMFLNMPWNQWTALLYFFLSTLVTTGVVRRMKRDVSLWAMAKSAYQEVTVPRAVVASPITHTVRMEIRQWRYDATPAPRWWQRAKTPTSRTSQIPAATAGAPGGGSPAPRHRVTKK